jgi:hypothetical protein
LSPLLDALRNEHTKRILYATRVRRPSPTRRETPHYRMPKLQAEVKTALPRYHQAVVDSEFLYHGAFHDGPGTRYALITSVASGPALEKWIESQLPYVRP